MAVDAINAHTRKLQISVGTCDPHIPFTVTSTKAESKHDNDDSDARIKHLKCSHD